MSFRRILSVSWALDGHDYRNGLAKKDLADIPLLH